MSQPNDQNLNLQGLTNDERESLHKALYRQERRAWSLALGLVATIGIFTSRAVLTDPLATKVGFYAMYAIPLFLTFWAVYPSQRILARLRKLAPAKDRIRLERRFENSWQSVWDYVPPLLPVLVLGVIFLWQLFMAM